MLSIDCLAVGAFEANCCLIWGSARQALVLDPGAEADTILDALERHRLEVAAYLVTHGHMDHVSALAGLYRKCPAPYAMQEADFRWAFSPVNQCPPYYPAPRQPPVPPRFLQDREVWIPAPELDCRILATPGHSPGSLCAYFEAAGVLFTGDTLFQGSVGRTDLSGGNQPRLEQSLKILTRLPPVTRIYPGHGPASTLAEELQSNPYLGG